LEYIDARSIKDLFGRRYGDGEVCVLGEARDEEHETAGLDLHFGEVCAAGGDVRMSAGGVLADSPLGGRSMYTYAMLCLWVLRMLDIRSKRSVKGFGSSVLRVTCATVRQVVLSYKISSRASITSASCSNSASIVPAFGMR